MHIAHRVHEPCVKRVSAKRSRVLFDPVEFLAKSGPGKAISKFQKDQIVFSQGDAVLGLLARQCHADADVDTVAAIVAPTNIATRKRLNDCPPDVYARKIIMRRCNYEALMVRVFSDEGGACWNSVRGQTT
jgi:hypothetical protein